MMTNEIEIGIADVRRLVGTIKSGYGHDFSNYALSSFKRRIARMINIGFAGSLGELNTKIKNDQLFYQSFVKELTVNVTEMFRDPSFWRVLKEDVLPNIHFESTLNIWHAGCSSGDEVFSMAVMLEESGLLDRTVITATDLNDDVLENAKRGIIPKGKIEVNSKNYERFNPSGDFLKYLDTKNGKTVLDGSLLEKVRFKTHNLALDEPISKFHLVLCRNVLIYFNQNLQDHVVGLLHDSMLTGGYLALGNKESLMWSGLADQFSETNGTEKVFQKMGEKFC